VELFDYVVLDTPPCLLYADALLIGSMVDGVVYVVRAGPQDRAAQRRAQKQLQQAKARVLGAVFNDVAPAEIAGYSGRHANGGAPSRQVFAAAGKFHPPRSSIERNEQSHWNRLIALGRWSSEEGR
jgi:Mrp family chromosome partitioning ATPase